VISNTPAPAKAKLELHSVNGFPSWSWGPGFHTIDLPRERAVEREALVEDRGEDPAVIAAGLARIRKRRWLLWSILIVYLPSMMWAQEFTGSFSGALPFFFGWCLLLVVCTAISAAARCPRCGNYFHVNGMVLLYFRRCLHCQLHLTADKKASLKSALL
jgi:hypothetical protein